MTDGIHMTLSSEDSVAVEELRACYDAWIQRGLARGDLSIRTPEGFRRLQKKYQPRLRFSIGTATHAIKAQDGDQETNGTEIDSSELREIVGVYFDAKISRMIADICWPMAHFENNTVDNEKASMDLELDEGKYCGFSVRLLQWIFPGLPCGEAEDIARYDWECDHKLDESGHNGLGFLGFTVSLVDVAVACNNGTVSKCLEFLQLMTRWLRCPVSVEHSLPTDPCSPKLHTEPSPAAIVWQDIPLSTLFPCQMDSQGLYCKLKTKTSKAPMAIMVMTADENPVELQLATSAKLLGCHDENPTDLTCSSPTPGAAVCWTFTGLNPSTPSLVIVPNSIISCRTKTLYVRLRALVSNGNKTVVRAHSEIAKGEKTSTENVLGNERSVQSPSTPPFVAVFTSLLEFTSLQFGSKNGVCLRMNRMSARTFTVGRHSKPFLITITASLLQATNSAGGAGAAAAVSSTVEAESTFTVREDQSPELREGGGKAVDGHTFVFIVKSSGVNLHEHGVTLPPQWFTSLNAINEKKTIVIESSPVDPASAVNSGDDSGGEAQRSEHFHIFIFTIHGLSIELSCSTTAPAHLQGEIGEATQAPPLLLTNIRTTERLNTGPATVYVNDDEANEFTKSFVNSEKATTSANLLKELLLLQKQRQLEISAEPPPDFLVGNRVNTSKPTTTAETLRTKILHSRQLERHARLLQLESALQNKLKRARRQSASDAPKPDSTDTNAVKSSTPKSELQTRANVLATFFHEMAMHQPRRDELHNGAAEAETEEVAEQQLLKHFGEIFDRDVALQNTLDEEKWSTEAAKVTRRKASISTNLPKSIPDNSTRRSRKQSDNDEPQWASEDYENTAQYIEQLMIDVANNELQQQNQQTLAEVERKNAVMEQLVASWEYTQHRTAKPATHQRVRELEQRRRSQWMQSEHVKVYDTVASARLGGESERAAIILPKQRFLVQEQSIPSNAVWEVPTSPNNQTPLLASGALAAAGLVSPTRPESPRTDGPAQSPVKIRPRRPTQQAVVATPPEERDSDITALRSAAFLRARVRRIRSAHSHPRVNVTASRQSRRTTSVLSPKDILQDEESPSKEKAVVFDIPASLLNHATQPLAYETSDYSQTSDTSKLNDDATENSIINEPPSLNTTPLESTVLDASITLGSPAAGDEKDENNKIKGVARRKRKKKRSAPPNVVRFRRSLMELASLPSKLRAAADDEWRQNERLEEFNSISLVLPNRPVKPKPRMRPQVDP